MTDTKAGPPSYKGVWSATLEHQFRKGVSGNPKGRLRRLSWLPRSGEKIDIGPEDRIQELVLEEAYRIIKVRDGEPR